MEDSFGRHVSSQQAIKTQHQTKSREKKLKKVEIRKIAVDETDLHRADSDIRSFLDARKSITFEAPASQPTTPTPEAKIRGSLLGLAWGDVLGCPVEGLKWWDIYEIFTGDTSSSPYRAPAVDSEAQPTEVVAGDEEGKEWENWKILPAPEDMPRLRTGYRGLPLDLPLASIKAVKGIKAVRKVRPLGLYSDDTQQALGLLNIALNRKEGLVDPLSWASVVAQGTERSSWRGVGGNFVHAAEHLCRNGVSEFRASARLSDGIGAAMRIGPMGAVYSHLARDLSNVVPFSEAIFPLSLVTHGSIPAAATAFAVALSVSCFVNGMEPSLIRKALPAAVRQAESYWRTRCEEEGWSFTKQQASTLTEQPVATEEGSSSSSAPAVDTTHFMSSCLQNIFQFMDKKRTEGPNEESVCPGFSLGSNISESTICDMRKEIQRFARELIGMGGKTQAFHPNQGRFCLGGVHAIAVGLLDGISDPQRVLLDVVMLGYDTDTIGAICGSILGARFGPSSFVENHSIIDVERLLAYADAMVAKVQCASPSVPVESLDEFLRREAALTAAAKKYSKQIFVMLYPPRS